MLLASLYVVFAVILGMSWFALRCAAVSAPQRCLTRADAVFGFVGGFEEAPVRQFLTGILTGRRKTAPISDVPLPEHTAEKCAELAAEAAASASEAAEAGDDGELDDLMAEIRAEEEAAKKAQEAELAAEAAAAKAEEDAASAKKSKKSKKKKKKKGSSDL